MLYSMHEYAYYTAAPLRALAQMTRDFWGSKLNPASDTAIGRTLYASAELFSNVTKRYGKPEWGIDTVTINDHPVRVSIIEDWSNPWVKLLRFQRDVSDLRRAGVKKPAPAVLIVAPLSGHYATLLRGTVQEFLLDHDVYITDWVNARQVPVLEGRFDFYSYMDAIRDMLTAIGSRAHVVAVCQPGPPVLATACLMAEDNDPCRPASMTFMGSPIDARFNPTVTNDLAQEKPRGFGVIGDDGIGVVRTVKIDMGNRFCNIFRYLNGDDRRPIRALAAASIRALSSSTAS